MLSIAPLAQEIVGIDPSREHENETIQQQFPATCFYLIEKYRIAIP